MGDGTRLTQEIAEHFLNDPNSVEIGAFSELDDAAAAVLANHEGELGLNGLTALSEAAATALARHTGSLLLNGVTSLSDVAANALAKYKGKLYLQGLTSLSDGPGHLRLARKLIFQNCVYWSYSFVGLTTLTDDLAEILSKQIGSLALPHVNCLSVTVAKALARRKGWLCLGLTALPADTAEALAGLDGALYLNRLISLSDAAAEELAKRKGDLHLVGLTSLSDTGAESLAKHKGRLFLAVNKLPPSAAEILGRRAVFQDDAKEKPTTVNRRESPPMNEPPLTRPAMQTVGQVIEFVRKRLGHIFVRPLMYGGTAEGVDLILHYYFELWAEMLGRDDDFHRIRIEVNDEDGCGTLGIVTQARREKPNANEQELSSYVIAQWRRIGERLKMSIPCQ